MHPAQFYCIPTQVNEPLIGSNSYCVKKKKNYLNKITLVVPSCCLLRTKIYEITKIFGPRCFHIGPKYWLITLFIAKILINPKQNWDVFFQIDLSIKNYL